MGGKCGEHFFAFKQVFNKDNIELDLLVQLEYGLGRTMLLFLLNKNQKKRLNYVIKLRVSYVRTHTHDSKLREASINKQNL